MGSAGLARRTSLLRACLAGSVAVALPGVVLAKPAGAAPSEEAIAAAINLKSADLPGFAASSSTSSLGASFAGSAARCDPAVFVVHAGAVGASSPDFSKSTSTEFDQVSSDVTIERTRTLVAEDLAAVRNPRLVVCLVSAVNGYSGTVSGHTVRAIDAHGSDVPFSVPGSDGAFDLRVQYAYNFAPELPFYIDLRVITIGRDELELETVTSLKTFATTTAAQLATLLFRRAVAHPH